MKEYKNLLFCFKDTPGFSLKGLCDARDHVVWKWAGEGGGGGGKGRESICKRQHVRGQGKRTGG